MSENEDQSADFAQDEAVEVAPPAPQETGLQAGVGMQAQRSNRRRGEGRRVTLARQHGGGYNIWMMNRHIQGFCADFEDITNFQLPDGIEQQVRIHVEAAGEARPIRPEYSGRDEVREVRAEEPVEARMENRSSSFQNVPRNELLRMFTELPSHNQEIIAGQIVANHQDVHGAALQSIAHPQRGEVNYGMGPEPAHPMDGVVNFLVGEIEQMQSTLDMIQRLRR